MKRIATYFFVILVLLFTVYIFYALKPYIQIDSILSEGDWPYYYLHQLTDERFYYFSTWLHAFQFDLAQAPTYFLFGLFAKLYKTTYEVGTRIVYFYPIILAPLFTWVFLYKMQKNVFSAFVGAVLYHFSAYQLTLMTGHITIAAAYAFFPSTVIAYILSIQRKSVAMNLLSTFFLVLMFAYEPRIAYITVVVLGIYMAVDFIASLRTKTISSKTVLLYVLPFIISFLIQLFWIIPLFATQLYKGSAPQEGLWIFSRPLWGGAYYNIFHALALHHPFWTGREIKIFTDSQIPYYLWILPFLVVCSVIFVKKNRVMLFAGSVIIAGIFLIKMDGSPLPRVYEFFYNTVPGFKLFREPSKFFGMISLGYAILIGYLITSLAQGRRKYLGWFIVGLCTAIPLINLYPFYTKEVSDFIIPKTIHPTTAQTVALSREEGSYRNGWVANARIGFGTSSMTNPGFNFDAELNTTIKKPYLFTKSLKEDGYFADAYSLNKIYVGEPLSNDAKIVKEAKQKISQLEKISYLREIPSGITGVRVFKNDDYFPHTYFSRELQTKNNYVRKTELIKKFVWPTQYEVNITPENGYIHFGEPYHPGWKLRSKDHNWLQSLFDSDYYYDETLHIKTDVGLNAWKIDKQWLESEGITGDTIPVTIYFAPQAWMNLGLIISGITFTCLVVALGYFGIKELKRKK